MAAGGDANLIGTSVRHGWQNDVARYAHHLVGSTVAR